MTSRWFYQIVNSISDIPINKNAADYRLISRRVANVFKEQFRERNMFLRGIISWIGFTQATVSFTVQPRAAGKSKYSIWRLLTFGTSGITSFSKKPLKAVVLVGVIFAGFGFVMALATFIQHFVEASLPSGWTTIVILLSIFSGIQLIFLGVVGEYIGEIFDEVKARPHYIVEEKVNIN